MPRRAETEPGVPRTATHADAARRGPPPIPGARDRCDPALQQPPNSDDRRPTKRPARSRDRRVAGGRFRHAGVRGAERDRVRSAAIDPVPGRRSRGADRTGHTARCQRRSRTEPSAQRATGPSTGDARRCRGPTGARARGCRRSTGAAARAARDRAATRESSLPSVPMPARDPATGGADAARCHRKHRGRIRSHRVPRRRAVRCRSNRWPDRSRVPTQAPFTKTQAMPALSKTPSASIPAIRGTDPDGPAAWRCRRSPSAR